MKRVLRKIPLRLLVGAGLIVLSLVMTACATNPATTSPSAATTAASPTAKPPESTTAVSAVTALTVVNKTDIKSYTLTELEALPSITGWGYTIDKAGKTSGPEKCIGVSLTNLIKAVGGMTDTQAVKITAQDGYSKTLSYNQVYWGDFTVMDITGIPVTAATQPVVSLVYSIDGNALDAATGPIQMGIMTAQTQVSEASMWVNQTVRIEVLQAITLNISAAASLTDALKEINTLYNKANPNVKITPNFASSGILQKQIEQGAPVDVFISAAATQMDNLEKGSLIVTDSRKDLLNNKVVLIVPADSLLGLTGFSDLTKDTVKTIAIGDPKSVPAGTYGQQAFDQLGITTQVQSKLVLGSDVRQVLSYVESGNVDAGILYSTDAKTSVKVKVVANAPDEINAKIVYPVAVIKASKNTEAARDYLNFLFTAKAKTAFEKYGFSVISN